MLMLITLLKLTVSQVCPVWY